MIRFAGLLAFVALIKAVPIQEDPAFDFDLTVNNLLPEEERPGRIVNGRDAEPGEIKYQASLQYLGGFAFCGGTYIGDGIVLTAAHCAREQTASNIKVVLGARNLEDKKNPTFNVKKIYVYNYDTVTKQGDVALLHLDMDPNERISDEEHPVEHLKTCDSSCDLVGENCVVSGWGHETSGSRTSPNILKVTDVEVVSNARCKKMVPKKFPYDSENDSMICAGGADKDACQGDSGGPLVCPDPLNRGGKCLAGAVSWGVGCATEGIPGFYTNLRKYNDWIEEMRQKIRSN